MPALLKRITKQASTLIVVKVLLFSCYVHAATGNPIAGSDGRDFIVTGPNAARVEAGAGDDFIVGGSGNNVYVINKDDGRDTIYELAGNNSVEFGAGISFSDVASGLMKSGDDLILHIGQAGQALTVKFFFSQRNTIAQFRLSNGQVLTSAQLLGAFGLAAPTATGVVPQLITAQAPDTELTGSAAADVLIARHGTLRMQSFAGNDILVPRGPAVTMEFGMGSGKNLIVAYEGDNTILFSTDVAFNDIAMNLRRSGDDLVLINSRDGSEVAVYQFFTRANTIARIRFASGGEISAGQLLGLFGVATPEQVQHYYMVAPGVSFDNNAPGSGGSGDDNGGGADDGGGDDDAGSGGDDDDTAPCEGNACTTPDESDFVIIEGTEQDDLLIADQRNSLFRAGPGNDIMLGGAGNDRYMVSMGDGNDVIIDTAGTNEVHFTADLVWADISSGLVRSGNDLMLRIGQSGQTLTVQNFFSLANTVEVFKLHSGQTLTRQQLFQVFSATAPAQTLPARQLILGRAGETLLQGTAQGDILLNRMAVTTIDAKAGDDVIIVQYTAPTHTPYSDASEAGQTITLELAPGHGKDVLHTLGDTALGVILNFAAGISRDEVFQNMRRMGADLFIKTYADSDEIRLVNFFSHYSHLERLQFAGEQSRSIYVAEIYDGFNQPWPEQPKQLNIGLPDSVIANCAALFSRYDNAMLMNFQRNTDISIQPPADMTVSIFNKAYLPFSADTPDNALACFILESAPDTMDIGADSGLASWSPDRSDIGSRQIRLKVVTDTQTYNTAEFELQIPDLNQAPVFTSQPRITAFNTVPFTDQLTAQDDDNYYDDIHFSLISAPAGFNLSAINSNTIDILWVPTTGQTGQHDIVIRAADIYGKYSELTYSIEVKTFHTLDTLPPGYSRVPQTGAVTFDNPLEDGATRLGTERVFERDHVREVVIDRVSGLVWQDNSEVNEIKRTHSDSRDYCESLELGGVTDWRLPTRLELAYLPNQQAIRYENAFINGWTYSYLVSKSKNYHAEKVFGTHNMETRLWEIIVGLFPEAINRSDMAYVRCVSGDKPYHPEYVRAELTDVVADFTHQLLWEDQQRIVGQPALSWEEQAGYCEDLQFAGFDDWRLPNNFESQALAVLFDEYGGGMITRAEPRMPPQFKYMPMMSGASFGGWLSANKGTFFKYRRGDENWVSDLTSQINYGSSLVSGYSRCVRTYSQPVPRVTHLHYQVYVNDIIRLDASGSYATEGEVVRYQWMNLANQQVLGEGETIDVSFDTAGQYQIELTVWDQLGIPKTSADVVTVHVKAVPVVSVTVPTEGLIIGNNILLDASGSYFTDGEITAFRWYSLPDNVLLGEGATLNVVVNEAGEVMYRLEIVFDDGRTVSHTIVFTVTEVPPVAKITGDVIGLTDTELLFDASESYVAKGQLSFRWFVDEELKSEQQQLRLNFAAAGIYTIRLVVTSEHGLTDTASLILAIKSPPVAKVKPFPSVIAQQSDLILDGSASTDADGQIVAYRWYRLPEQTLVGGQDTLVLNAIAAGLHQYRLEVEDNSGLTGTAEVTVQAGYVPVAVIDGPQSAYADTEILLNANSSHIVSGQLNYNWSLDGEFISDQAVITLNVPAAGAYQLTLQVSSEVGLTDTAITELTVLPPRELAVCPLVPVTDDRSYNGLYPDDNIAWTGGNAATVDDIARAFNHARSLDPSVHQYLLMPSQAQWNAMNVQQKGLYLVNAERVARGIKPYAGYDAAMVDVAQTYATYIHSRNQVIGHYNDGRSPMQRMQANSYINQFADSFISKPESVASTSGTNPVSDDYALATSIYGWIYEDKDWFVAFGIDGTPWGHRYHLLQTGLDDNHADGTTEGVAGFGLAKGFYQPGGNPPTLQGAVTVFKTIDQGPDWDTNRIQTVDVSQAQGCPVHQLDIAATEAELSGLRQLQITPASIHLVVGQSTQLTVTGIYQDGSQRDLTALAQFRADTYSVVSVQNGVLYAEQSGDTTVSVSLAGIESNRVYISVGEAADTSVLNGTEAALLKDYIADNATVRNINPLAVAVYSGVVHDRYGTPLAGVQLSLLHAPDYGSVNTDNDGRFILAGPAGEHTLVYEKPGYVVLQRTTIGASSNWAALPDVTLLQRDSKQSFIDLTSGTAQVHQSTLISDEFGERKATVVFNGITSAEIRSRNGARRPVSQFMFSATEFETPPSMPGELPLETAFTWASDLHVDGTHYTDSVHYNADVVLYLDNFLGFPVGEIVPVGYFDRTISKWIASPNGVVVRLLDQDGDGIVDGVDYNDDGIADDISGNGSTADEAIGLAGYRAGDTLWRAAFNHMTPVDLNWAAEGAQAPDAIELLDGDTGAEDEKNCENANTGSFAKPYQQSFHEDIAIAGTDLRLHYSSQRTSGYKHKIHVAVSGNTVPAALEKMIARFEIAGRVFEQEFNPAPNVEAEFIWDGTHPDGSRAQGIVSGRISIGFEYPTVYLSSGNAAATGQPLASFPVAWATLSDVVTQVPGRQNVITWQQRGVSIKNSFDSQLAEGWSLSNVHEFDPKGKVYFGSGMVADVATSSLILRTGQTYSHIEGDDGYYQAGGRNTDYVISSDNTVVDRVTGLEWQNAANSLRFRTKAEASAYCAAIPTDNEHSWRLPTPKEVGYTIDKSGASSGQMMYSITQARGMWHENTLNDNNRLIAAVCLRGNKLDNSTITGLSRNASLDVVVDKNSGLMWQDSADNTGVKLDWQASIAHCEASEHAGFDDWRLPNINELLYTLPNQVFQHYTTLPAGVPWDYDAPQRNPYWSSTTNLQDDEQAWAIESISFNSEHFKKEDAYHVRCVRQDSTSSRMPFRFNSKGQHTTTFDNSAGKDLTLYQYDDAGKLSHITDRFGNTLYIERNAGGRVTAIVAPDGQRTQLSVDQHNHLTRVSYDDGSQYQFYYREGGLLAEKTDPNNAVFGRHYNALGRVERVTAPEGADWQFFDTRDARGVNRYGYHTAENNSYQTERKVLANGAVQFTTSNETGGQTVYSISADELSETSTAYGVTTTVTNVLDSKTLRPIPHTIVTSLPSGLSNSSSITKTYAENGADTSIYTLTAHSNGKTSTTQVNARTGISQSTSPEGRSSTRYLDPATLLLSRLSVPGLLDTTYSYDSRGRLLQSSTGERHTQYSYDATARGLVSSITAADGQVTAYEYDDVGRVTRVTYPDGHSTQTQYDANGNAVRVIVPSFEQHDFTVNGVGNTDSETRPVNSTTRYVYNRDKQLTAIELPSGDSIYYVYQHGRLVSTQTPEGSSEYQYQQGDQLVQVSEGNEAVSYSYDGTVLTALHYSGELNTSLNYSYNSDLQVNSLNYAGGSTALSYDKDGLVSGIHGFNISYRADNGLPQQLSDGKLSQSWQWNGYGEATNVQYQLGNQVSLGYNLQYNAVGQIISKTERQHDGSERVYHYGYDDRYRLVEVKQNGIVTEAYEYDPNGNRISHSSLLRNVVNQTASYALGDQIVQSGNAIYAYDANGRLSQKTVMAESDTTATQYQYSSTGRLLAVTTADKAISYRHNALGQRVAKLVNGAVTEKYLWQDLTTLLAVYNADDTVKQRFEYGLNHTPVSFTQSGQRYYIQTDHLGSPRVISNSSGNIVKAISYDSYGNVIEDSNPEFAIPFGFAGGLYDADTKLIRFGYRDYDPETGRWTARDPIGFAGGDTNLYGYVLGDPVNFIDPDGLKVSVVWYGPHPSIRIESQSDPRLNGQWSFGPNPSKFSKLDYAVWLGGGSVPGIVHSEVINNSFFGTAPQIIYESDRFDSAVYNNIMQSMSESPDYSWTGNNCISWMHKALHNFGAK